MLIGSIADKYLASGMTDLSKRFKLSPTLSAITLIAFANGAPDIIGAIKGSDGESGDGPLVSIGALLGAFLFSSTLAFANVTFSMSGPI